MEENNKKTDAITAEAAKENRLLIAEDMAKIDLAIAQVKSQVAMYEARKAECMLALADIDRREAGVAYPEPPKPEAKEEAKAETAAAAPKAEEAQA